MDPHSFIARAEAQRWLGIAEKLLISHDLVGSKTFAIRARESDPRLESADQILAIADTLLAAEKRVVGNNGSHQADYYAILQLVRFVEDTDQIASQYRRLAVLLNPHQNRFPYSDQAFQLVNDAWGVLSNPMRKSLYDSDLGYAPQQQMNTLGFNLEQQHQQQQPHNFFSINHLGGGHEQEMPEQQQQQQQQTFQSRLHQSHQHQQLQQHNFLSQPVREQEHLFQHREQEQLFQSQVQPFQVTSPPHQSRPSPQPPQQQSHIQSPPATSQQPPFSWAQTQQMSQQQKQSQLQQQFQHQQLKQEQLQQEQLKQQQMQQEQLKQQKMQQEQLKQQQLQEEQRKQQQLQQEKLKQQQMEEQRKQQQLMEEQRKQQQMMEEQRKQQQMMEEQRKQQQLMEEQRKQQQLMEEQRKQQQLMEEQRKQQQLMEEQRKQQLMEEQRKKQLMEEQRKKQMEDRRKQMMEEQRKKQMLEEQRKQQLIEEQKKQQQLMEEQRKQQQMIEEQRKQQQLMEEQRKQQQLLEEQRKQQQLQEEQRKQQQLLEEQRKQQLLEEEKRKQQLLQEEQLKQQKLQEEQLKQQQLQQEQLKQQQESAKENATPGEPPSGFNSNNGVRTEQAEPEAETEPADDSPTFWTACPYCFYMYEYPKVYVECTLRCDNCKRAFQAVRISSPPPIIEGQDACFYCWGFIPVGLSMSDPQNNNKGTNSNWTPFSSLHSTSNNVQNHLNEQAAPKENLFVNKSSGPRIYIDDITDDVFLGVSEPSSDSDTEWDVTKKQKPKTVNAGFKERIQVDATKKQKPKTVNAGFKESFKERIQVLALRALDTTNPSRKDLKHRIPVQGAVLVKVNAGKNRRKQSGRVAKELGKLDLNVELSNNEGVETATRVTNGIRGHVQGEEDNNEGNGFFEGLDEYLSSLPILSIVKEEKVKVG